MLKDQDLLALTCEHLIVNWALLLISESADQRKSGFSRTRNIGGGYHRLFTNEYFQISVHFAFVGGWVQIHVQEGYKLGNIEKKIKT